MASSGRALETTFTPSADCELLVTITFRAESSGSDWGASQYVRAFCEQGGTTTYAADIGVGNAMNSYTVLGKFSVVAGSVVKAGLHAGVTGAASITLHDISARYEQLKR